MTWIPSTWYSMARALPGRPRLAIGWVLSYHADGNGNSDDYIVGLGLPDVDAAVEQARQYLRAVGYPVAGWPSS